MTSTCECKSAPQSCGCARKLPGVSEDAGLFLTIAAVPMQSWSTPYDAARGLQQGTIFPELDKPFFKTGGGFYG